jgi:hypothetical protein
MIKLQNNTLSRDPIPSFLVGLAPESLADLSWTDPNLGVADCKWLPETDQSPALAEYERYGAETLELHEGTVMVTRAVVPWTQAEIDADLAAKARSTALSQITALEATVTQRRLREAVTTDAGKTWLAGVDAQISALRGQI